MTPSQLDQTPQELPGVFFLWEADRSCVFGSNDAKRENAGIWGLGDFYNFFIPKSPNPGYLQSRSRL